MTTGRKVNGWRKLARSMWGPPSDPQFYGDLEVDAANALSFIDAQRRASGAHVTLTHLTVKAIAAGLQAVPSLNVRLTRGREYPRESVDVFVIVAVGRDELTGIKICDADRKSAVEIAREVEAQSERIRLGQDEQLGRTKKLLETVPARPLRYAMRAAAWLTSDRHLDLP